MNLNIFSKLDFLPALHTFFEKLNIPINHLTDEPTTAKEILIETHKDNDTFKLTNDVYFVGMIDDNAFKDKKETVKLSDIKKDYDGILIFGVTLHNRPNGLLPTRTQLADIARAFNREFYYTPVVVVFKYNNHIAFANTERLKYKQEWREGEKAGKVSLLRDVNIDKPHAGHQRILAELKIPTSGINKVDSFAKLYAYWQEVLSVNILNKKFYQELSNWYFWAIQNVQFPGKPTFEDAITSKKELKDLEQEHKATNVIRMLTRLLFVWFLKEKKLIPNELFDLKALQQDILNNIDPVKQNGFFEEQNTESVYYKAILQNLFFATLNCPIESDSIDKRKRGFRLANSNYGTMFLMRYEKHFKNKDGFLAMVNQTVPFLNGGLFECLDERGIGEKRDERKWIDGFSDNLPKDQQLVVPDYLFFGLEEEADLSDVVGIEMREYKQAAVKGLINILESYKFTITENTPIEEDVALDPELLGKVFENLLASYNPETKTTARKQTGSFYTPREIVNYMVDESLIAYLTTVLEASSFEKDNPKQDASGTSIPNQDGSGTIFLDPNSEIEIKQGLLPHWKQDNVYYFVTFRLADSIPSDKQEELKADREKWNRRTKDKKDYTKEDWKEYNRLFNNRVEDWLNAGYGSCLLGKPENASIVANALKHFDNQRYLLDEWVVMPNHVHVLVKPLGENKITDILHSWKSYTANEINKQEGRIGQLWMRESYDHIVRNEDSLNHIRHYIQQNPAKAGITLLEASTSTVLEASSFEKLIPKQDASGTSQDALRELVSFDPTNPFIDNKQISKEIITALSTCTIIDPACGSGAFPMGILQKMVHILQKLDPSNEIWFDVQFERANEESRNVFGQIEDEEGRQERLDDIYQAFDQTLNDPDYARKLFLIENCIFGVDIQPIATQISKLRFFISLVVDQKVNPEKKNFSIRALPNLETKFVAANTLIGIDRPKKGDQLNIFNTDKQKKLEAELKIVRSKLFSAKTRATKVKYRNRDEELRNEIAAELLKNGWESDKAQKLAGWDPYDQNASSSFFDPEWMFDIKEGFDVVIGNPPYVNVEKIDPEIKAISKTFRTAYQKYDLYVLFYEKAIDFLKHNGSVSFITSNKFLSQGYGLKLRKEFLKHTITEIINFNYDVFDSATVRTCVLQVIKREPSKQHSINIIDVHSKSDAIKFENLLYSKIKQSIFNNTEQNNFRINLTNDKLDVIAKIEDNTILVEDVFSVNYGLRPSSQVLNLKKEAFIYFKKEKSHFKKYFEGKDMGYWKIKNKSYLDYQPNVMYNPMFDNLFRTEKIIGLRTLSDISKLRFVYDNNGYYCNDSVVILTLWHLFENETNRTIERNKSISKIKNSRKFEYHYVQAILNSSVIKYYFNELMYDGTHFYPNHMKALPLKKTDFENQNIYINISNYNHFLEFSNNQLEYNFFNKLSDSIVFELYFTEEFKSAKIEILNQLYNLKPIKDITDENEKMRVIQSEFERFNSDKHPVKHALETLETLDEIRIIRESLK